MYSGVPEMVAWRMSTSKVISPDTVWSMFLIATAAGSGKSGKSGSRTITLKKDKLHVFRVGVQCDCIAAKNFCKTNEIRPLYARQADMASRSYCWLDDGFGREVFFNRLSTDL